MGRLSGEKKLKVGIFMGKARKDTVWGADVRGTFCPFPVSRVDISGEVGEYTPRSQVQDGIGKA
jgi:hypothetical protein